MCRRLVGAVAAVLVLCAPARALAAPVEIARLNGPIGVATADDGSLFVTYDGIGDVRLVKLSPAGQVLRETAFGGFTSVGAVGKLAIDPGTGVVWDLLNTGTIKLFDPNTLATADLGSLAATPIDATDVFDVSAGTRRDLSGSVTPSLASYGDVAVLRTGDRLDVFVTARSSGGSPWVARLRFDGGQMTSARAIAAASLSSRYDDVARGVAVNAAGTVLTTLPTPNAALDVVDRAYAFSAGFPEAGGAPRLVMGGADLSSRGMAADAACDFYVTGTLGSTRCGVNAAGAVVVLAPDGSFVVCHPFALVANMQDVAVNRDGAAAYTTLLRYPGSVLAWGRLAVAAAQQAPVVPPAAGGGAPARDQGSVDAIARTVNAGASVAAGALGRLRIAAVLARGGFTIPGVQVPEPGTLTATVVARGARMAVAARTVTVARGSRSFTRSGAHPVKVTLTAAGRRLLRRSRRLPLTLTLRFAAASGRSAQMTRKVTLRR